MGRNREPLEKKKSRGTVRPVRERGATGVALPGAIVKVSPPKHMTKEQKKTFKFVTKVMGEWGILQVADLGLVEAYVVALHSFRDNQLLVQKEGAYVNKVSAKGFVIGKMEAPWSRAMKEDMRMIKDLGSKLAFSPVDRARILSMLAPKEEEKDDFAEFIEL